jgi:hypothetical protein
MEAIVELHENIMIHLVITLFGVDLVRNRPDQFLELSSTKSDTSD